MKRDFFRIGKNILFMRKMSVGLAMVSVFPLSNSGLAATSPDTVLALSSGDIGAMMPLAITGGAGLFAILACAMWLRARRKSTEIEKQAALEIGTMRATLDHAEAILSGMDKLIINWPSQSRKAQVFGSLVAMENVSLSQPQVVEFSSWLVPESASELSAALDQLRTRGAKFSKQLTTLTSHIVQVEGQLTAGTPLLRFSDVFSIYEQQQRNDETNQQGEFGAMNGAPDFWLIAKALKMPIWSVGQTGQLLNANDAYLAAVSGRTLEETLQQNLQFFPIEALNRNMTNGVSSSSNARIGMVMREEGDHQRKYEITAAYADRETIYSAIPAMQLQQSGEEAGQSIDQMMSAAIDHLVTPTAMFDHDRQITHYNQAFVDLWHLDDVWLDEKPNEMAILDRLRTEGKLPNEVDYRAWRDRHLQSYRTQTAMENLWYLPDGRTLKVVATPAQDRCVTYTYENVTGQLELESRYKTLTRVQGETLAHLSEGVVVFGTNGCLDLHNPVFARQWHISTNLLNSVPHIDAIIAECAKEFGSEALGIWNMLRAQVISLGQNRQTRNGRISRSDNTLFDYLIVPLPDGKTMMNFVEVTASANLEKALKERNDALEMTDRLKDDFIQHVSYELRTPLTNIIGFSDMLNDSDIGVLNAKQREYASFIRSSSSSLKILVDHILDLANIDAGVAELNLSEVDILEAIHEARDGVESKLADNLSDKKINLVISVEPDLEIFTADHARIVQILYNLLSNAATYSEPGDRIELSCFDDGENIVFAVQDEGIGIPADIAGSVFDLFQGRGKNGGKRGAGLGLSIVRAFVELHGGKASISSRNGEDQSGTRIEIRIPKSLRQIKDAAVAAGAA